MVDPNLSADAKSAQIGNLTELYNNQLQMQSHLTGLDLGTLISKEAITSGASPLFSPGAIWNRPATPLPPPLDYGGSGGGSGGGVGSGDGVGTGDW
jgi:hypothetical protein